MMNTKENQQPKRTSLSSEGEFPSEIAPVVTNQVTHHKLEILRRKEDLLEEILSRENMQRAWKQVRKNKGAAGIDGLSIEDTEKALKTEWLRIKESLLNGSYKPTPVKEVRIPKPAGGERKLGIPIVKDRLIQQAIAQTLMKYIDESFEDTSYGFRPGRSAKQAVLEARKHAFRGWEVIIDIDLEAFFDTINQDRLMSELKKKISDQRVLNLIRRYLNSGIMTTLGREEKAEGVPQGGPLSPLLSNIYLDALDKEVTKRGHKYVRYADDCKIFVRTERAGKRVKESIRKFIEKKLKLRVNEKKSGVSKDGQILGFVVSKRSIEIMPKALKRFKDKIRELTPIRGGKSIVSVLETLAPVIRGWGEYFKIQTRKSSFKGIDAWIRRRVRALIYQSYKNGSTRYRAFRRERMSHHVAFTCAHANYGPWSMAMCKPMRIIFSDKKLKEMGLISLAALFYDDGKMRKLQQMGCIP
jgi:RNA-directed DNA polymerase